MVRSRTKIAEKDVPAVAQNAHKFMGIKCNFLFKPGKGVRKPENGDKERAVIGQTRNKGNENSTKRTKSLNDKKERTNTLQQKKCQDNRL